MKKYLIAAIIPFNVFATGVHNEPNNKATSNSFASSHSASFSNASAKANVNVGVSAQGGQATSVNGGNSVSINNPSQWPSSFVSGFSASSPAGCRTGLGVQGGYGGIVLPLDDEDCELAVAAQMALSVGDAKNYCRLMSKTEAYEIAEITFDECFAKFKPSEVTRESWLEEFNRKYPPLH